MTRDEIYQTIIGVIAVLFLIFASSDLYGGTQPKDTMWAKCIQKDTILDCKLIGHKVVINGKDINVTRLGVIELHNVVYVLLKEI